MREQHPASLEKVGVGLVCSVETYRGCNIALVKKQSGFNGLSTNKDGAENPDFITNIRSWMKATRKLTRGSGLKFLPKLQLKFPLPLDKLVKHLIEHPDDESWHDSVIEIWQNKGTWICLYAD
jgi:hypothetical protein